MKMNQKTRKKIIRIFVILVLLAFAFSIVPWAVVGNF
jgi:CHASE3 domain sensor protein